MILPDEFKKHKEAGRIFGYEKSFDVNKIYDKKGCLMTKMKKNFTARLKEYSKTAQEVVSGKKTKELLVCSLAAGPLLASQTPALAWVSYTGGPPVTLNASTSGYFPLDFNGDGILDAYLFMAHTNTGPVSADFAGIVDLPTSTVNGKYYAYNYFLGTVGPPPWFSFYVQTLPSNYMIKYTSSGSNYWLPFIPFYSGILGSGYRYTTTPGPTITVGNFPGQGDKILGVEFYVPATDNWHYGWVKVAVAAGAKSMQIKEWAYESCPAEPILAGATTGGAECSISIPTLSEWGQCVFILILAALAVRAMKNKREETA